MTKLTDALADAAGATGAVLTTADPSKRSTWGEVHSLAVHRSRQLQALGVQSKGRVGLLSASTMDVVAAIEACWLAGAAITVLQPPARGMDINAYVRRVKQTVAACRLDLILIDEPYLALASTLGQSGHVVGLKEFAAVVVNQTAATPALNEGSWAVLQCTSGSTGKPKVSVITHAALYDNIMAMRAASHHDLVHETMLSWLPLYHDMGLVGFLAVPMSCGKCNLIISDTSEFLSRPQSWLENIAAFRGTATAAPNFAYGLATRILRSGTVESDLSSLKLAICGGEMVSPRTISAFLDVAVRYGFDKRAFAAAYGLAECTLGVTMSSGTGLHIERVQREALIQEGVAIPASLEDSYVELSRLGPPVPGTSIRIVDPETGALLPDSFAGEILVRTPSVTIGYLEGDHLVPATRDDGWLPTGDLGYIKKRELVVCGRIKDVIIVGGRNIYPEEVEAVTNAVAGVRPGSALAFSVTRDGGTEILGVCLETKEEQRFELKKRIQAAIRTNIGLAAEVHILEPGGTPKTTSGKLRRGAARSLFNAGASAVNTSQTPTQDPC